MFVLWGRCFPATNCLYSRSRVKILLSRGILDEVFVLAESVLSVSSWKNVAGGLDVRKMLAERVTNIFANLRGNKMESSERASRRKIMNLSSTQIFVHESVNMSSRRRNQNRGVVHELHLPQLCTRRSSVICILLSSVIVPKRFLAPFGDFRLCDSRTSCISDGIESIATHRLGVVKLFSRPRTTRSRSSNVGASLCPPYDRRG